MNTLLLGTTQKDLDTAAGILRLGGLVAVPTETVYGLAADALNAESVKKVFKAKGRPMDNPLIVHIASLEDIESLGLVREFPKTARMLSERFWPGPLTLIMKKGEVIPDEVSAGLDTVAIRMPSHEVTRELIRRSGCALAAPSANSSGLPSPTTASRVMEDLNGRIDAVVDGGRCTVGVESTVLTLVTDPPRILRPGRITKEEIEEVIGKVEIDPAVISGMEKGQTASSPGMKYKHYSPKVKVVLIRSDDRQYRQFLDRRWRRLSDCAALCYEEDLPYIDAPAVSLGRKDDLEGQARRLFEALREADEIEDIRIVYAHCPKAQGVGLALYNRLIRAAAFEVIEIPKVKIIGLTGQSGAGKSEVAALFKERGIPVIDADLAARRAVEDPEILKKLREAFSDEIIREDGSLDRRKTAEIVFCDDEAREYLNSVTHPKILEIMLGEAKDLSEQGEETVVFDAPQLFEAWEDFYCDRIIAVVADRQIRLKRIIERDLLSEEEATHRIDAQFSQEFFKEHSDDVIENNGSLSDLFEQANRIFEVLYG